MTRPRVALRWLRRAAWTALALLLVIQFVPFGREHPNPAVSQAAPWPSERAEQIAQRSCAACHSNTTDWPWYAHVAPASWLVTTDVAAGRDELNFSTWDRDDGEADDAIEAILEGSMPPLRYVLLHPGARLDEQEQRIIVDALRQMDD
jgi:mono/diheme cytochrome c family protein